MTFCLFLFYILFPNNLVTIIFFPVKQGIYLENGIRPPFLFYRLGKFFLQVSQTVSISILSLWLIFGCLVAHLHHDWGGEGGRVARVSNRPFPSSRRPLFQNEGRCSAFDLEVIFHCHANKMLFLTNEPAKKAEINILTARDTTGPRY